MPAALPKIYGLTDCDDVHRSLTAPAMGSLANKTLILYIAALRDDLATGRLAGIGWIDTEDNLANTGTKLEHSGILPLGNSIVSQVKQSFYPKFNWKWNRHDCYGTSRTGKNNTKPTD
jgi:hypothetical protein